MLVLKSQLQAYFIFQQLPTKAFAFANYSLTLNTKGVAIKFLKAKQAQGLFRWISNKKAKPAYLKYATPLVLMYSKGGDLFNVYFKDKNDIHLPKNLRLLGGFINGSYYHASTLKSVAAEYSKAYPIMLFKNKSGFLLINLHLPAYKLLYVLKTKMLVNEKTPK